MPSIRRAREEGRRRRQASGGHSERQLSLYSSPVLSTSPLGRLFSSPGMAIFINQATFFLLCDKIFSPRGRLTGLYSLLFYNVAGYLISYGKELLESRKGYSPFVEVSEQSHVRHLAMSATKVRRHHDVILNYCCNKEPHCLYPRSCWT